MKIQYFIIGLILVNILIEIATHYREKYKTDQNVRKPKPKVSPRPLTDAQKKKIEGKQALAGQRK